MELSGVKSVRVLDRAGMSASLVVRCTARFSLYCSLRFPPLGWHGSIPHGWIGPWWCLRR